MPLTARVIRLEAKRPPPLTAATFMGIALGWDGRDFEFVDRLAARLPDEELDAAIVEIDQMIEGSRAGAG